MLVIIGKNWLGVNADGSSRIAEADDIVHAEVRTGLELARQGRLVLFPILLDDATMPTAQQLPLEIADIAGLYTVNLRSDSKFFVDSINHLLDAITEHGIARRKSGPILAAPERMWFNPYLGLTITEPAPVPTQPTASASLPAHQASSAVTPPRSASRPPTPVAPQQRTIKRSDWQTIGAGLVALILAIILPTQTSMCTTDQFGQQFCQTTIYTYNGVSASTAKTILFIIGLAILAWGIYTVRRRWSE